MEIIFYLEPYMYFQHQKQGKKLLDTPDEIQMFIEK